MNNFTQIQNGVRNRYAFIRFLPKTNEIPDNGIVHFETILKSKHILSSTVVFNWNSMYHKAIESNHSVEQ
ncbi:hypothetical protein D3C87_498930 [compost metagenome]